MHKKVFYTFSYMYLHSQGKASFIEAFYGESLHKLTYKKILHKCIFKNI